MMPGGRAARLLVVALAALAPYLRTVSYGFAYDDVPIIVERAELHGASGLVDAWRIPYWSETAQQGAGLYRPIAQAAYAILWNAGGGSPLLFHLYALALHVGAAILVLLLLQRALPPAGALIGALVFAVHPVHVESVANIVGSAEVVVALAALAYTLILVRQRGRTIGWPIAALLAVIYSVALGAKESGVMVPAAAFVACWGWRTRDEVQPVSLTSLLRTGWRAWLLSAVALAGMIGARWLVLGTLAVDPDAVAIGIRGVSTSERIWTMLAAFPIIARLLLWPSRLVMHYGPHAIPTLSGPTVAAVLSIAVLALLTVCAALAARRGERRPLIALGWIGLTFLPASNLLVPTGQLLAERTLYLPSVGVAMLAGYLTAWAARPLATHLPQVRPRVLALPVLAIVLAGGAATMSAASRWSDNSTLFASAIAQDPLEYRPHLSLASAKLREGQRAEAMAHMARAWSLYQRDPAVAIQYGRELMTDGDYERALSVLRPALAVTPKSTFLRLQYLSALLAARGPDSLLADVRAYPEPDPAGPSRVLFVARAFETKHEPDSVVAVLGAAAAAAPRDGAIAYLLAVALHRASRDAEADRQLDSADRLAEAPLVARAFLRAQIALARGDTTGARTAITAARQAAPEDTAVARVYAELHSR